MCYCGHDKVKWYLDRGVAEVVEIRPHLTVRLLFEPEGLGKAGDPFYLQVRENKCCVCGSKEDLTKHHVIPLCYRRHLNGSRNTHHDVLPICRTCHNKYERDYAIEVRQNFAKRYKAPLGGLVGDVDAAVFARVSRCASALVRYGDRIPANRRNELRDVIDQFLGRLATWDEILELSENYRERDDYLSHPEIVAQKITDLDTFYKIWRRHFVHTMRPRFLPEHWSINRSIVEETMS